MFRYPVVKVQLRLFSGTRFPIWLLKPRQRRGDLADN